MLADDERFMATQDRERQQLMQRNSELESQVQSFDFSS